eukprot:COSAG06_NODE_360_length_16832_cov_9.250209_1_plen_425_part_00
MEFPKLPLEGPLNPVVWSEPQMDTGGSFAYIPVALLVRILTGYGSDNLLVDTAVRAQVHPQWWRVLRSTDAYGLGIRPRAVRLRQICKAFSCRLRHARGELEEYLRPRRANARRASKNRGMHLAVNYPSTFNVGFIHAVGCVHERKLDNGYEFDGIGSHFINRLDEPVALALGAALQARDTPLKSLRQAGPGCFQELYGRQYRGASFVSMDLTPTGMLAVARGLSNGLGNLFGLMLDHNPQLGDEGMKMLARGIPRGLHWLDITKTGCSDSGMACISDVLPATLRSLTFSSNPVGDMGWAALARKVPQLSELAEIYALFTTPGFGPNAAAVWSNVLQPSMGRDSMPAYLLTLSADRLTNSEDKFTQIRQMRRAAESNGKVCVSVQWSAITDADAERLRDNPFADMAFSVEPSEEFGGQDTASST